MRSYFYRFGIVLFVATFGCVLADGATTTSPLPGFNHERLTYRHQGRDFRLTDVAGNVVDMLLA